MSTTKMMIHLRRSLFLTTACCAGFALASPALAQKEAAGMIQPKGGWAVTRIDNSSTQGGAYCTLARQYQNGIVFSVGRNQAEEYSVALDFQDARLNVEKAYDITLKAGNQTRQLQMIPVNARAIVIRLGWDDSFFAALEKAQSMTAILDKETYALAMPEYIKGKTDLAECMVSLKSAAPAKAAGTDVLAAESGAASGFSATKMTQAEAPATPPTAISKADPAKRPEKTNITKLETPEVAGLAAADKAAYVAPLRSKDVAALEAENERLRQQLNTQRQSYETRLAQSQSNRVTELEEKLRLAESRGSGAPAVAPAPVPVPAPVVKEVVKEVVKPDPAQAQRIAELEQQVARLNKDLAARNDVTMKPAATPMPNPEQAKRITDLQDEVAALKTQLAAANKAMAAPVPVAAPAPAKSDDVSRYEARIASLEAQLAAAKNNAGSIQKKPLPAASATADEQAQRQIALLQNEVKQKDMQIRTAQQRVAGREGEIEQLRRQISQLRSGAPAPAAASSAERLKRDNDALREQLAQQKDMYERKLAALEAGNIAPAAAPAPVTATSLSPVPRGPSGMADATPSPVSVAPVELAAGGSGLKSILSRAGISANNGTPTNGASEAYQWRSGALSGQAQAYKGKGNALDVSQQYANAQRSACSGDFASVPGSAQNGRVSLDIACVDGKGAKAQSLLFTEQGGQVLAFIINAPAEEMDQAMDARDKLSGNL